MELLSWLRPKPRPWDGRIILHRLPNAWGRALYEDHAFGLGLYRGAIVVRYDPAVAGAVWCREVVAVETCRDPPDRQIYSYRPISSEEATANLPAIRRAFGDGAAPPRPAKGVA